MVSGITNTCRVRFYRATMNSDLMRAFLKRLLKDEPGHKVFIICANPKVHHSIPIKAWLEEWKERISLFYLPSYAPGSNPDEYLNSDLKNSTGSKLRPRNEDEIQTSAEEFMAFLSEKLEHVYSQKT